MKLQSAMEYLMTYGWAILVIAIVLGVLYYVGVFNGFQTVPRAQPGSCQIYRPGGPGTNQNVNLGGICTGLPEFVAQFNGQNQFVTPASVLLQSAANNFTFSAWIYSGNCGPSSIVSEVRKPGSGGFEMNLQGCQVYIYTPCQGSVGSSSTLNTNTYYNVVVTFANSLNTVIYVNGQNQGSHGFTNTCTSAQQLYIGYGFQGYFNGIISNVQIYNATLSQAEVTALYNEGIGGAPVKPANALAWYPLNGNLNDYSGNNYEGQAYNGVHFVSNWTSAYTGPGNP